MFDVLCVGDINQDVITTPLKRYPKKNEQVIIPKFKYYLGGSSAICASALSTLGLRVCFVGSIGNDFYGKSLKEKLKCYKVKAYLKISKKPTDTTFAITFEDGSRSFITSHGANAELNIKDVKMQILKFSKHLHVSGYWHLESLRPKLNILFSRAKKHNISTSLDIGATIEDRDWKQIFPLLRHVDILFLNDYELKLLAGTSSLLKGIKKVLPFVQILALHLGPKGALACTADKRVRLPSYNVKVINPTGAGDTFNAGFLYAYLNKMSLQACLKYALANACLYISKNEQVFPTPSDIASVI